MSALAQRLVEIHTPRRWAIVLSSLRMARTARGWIQPPPVPMKASRMIDQRM